MRNGLTGLISPTFCCVGHTTPLRRHYQPLIAIACHCLVCMCIGRGDLLVAALRNILRERGKGKKKKEGTSGKVRKKKQLRPITCTRRHAGKTCVRLHNTHATLSPFVLY